MVVMAGCRSALRVPRAMQVLVTARRRLCAPALAPGILTCVAADRTILSLKTSILGRGCEPNGHPCVHRQDALQEV